MTIWRTIEKNPTSEILKLDFFVNLFYVDLVFLIFGSKNSAE